MEQDTSLFKKLTTFFSWQRKVSGDKVTVDPVSSRPNPNEKAPSTKNKFPNELKELWNWYLSETADTSQTLRYRKERYDDMEYAIYNEPLIAMAVNLYADECAQMDDKYQLFKVTSKNPEVAKEIRTLLEKWNINQAYIREVAYNLVAYGDSFDIVDSNPKDGVTSLTPIDIYDITDRLEFKASEIEKRMRAVKFYSNSKSNSINDYMLNMTEILKVSPSSAYISYLFGFVYGENHYLAPWQVLHYKLNSRKSEFFPFGRPLFINLIGPFRQLKTSMNLLALARAQKFPKQVFKVDTSEEMTASEKWEAVNEARQEFSNSGKRSVIKDEFALGEEIWMPKDLIEFDSISNNISLDDIADVELLRDNLIMGTGIPKGYLIVNESNWGTSSQSLLQQSKPFARAAYRIQSEIMDRIAYLLRLHFLITGKFDKEFTEFELEMNFPVIEEASDRITAKKDSMDFAMDVINNLKDAIGYSEDELPIDLVKQVFAKFSFLSPEELDDYIDQLYKAKNKQSGDGEPGEYESSKFEEKYANRLTEETLNNAYFESCSNHGVSEYLLEGHHGHISRRNLQNKTDSDIFEMLRGINKIRKERMKESELIFTSEEKIEESEN